MPFVTVRFEPRLAGTLEEGNSSQRTFHHFDFSVNVTLLSGNEVDEQGPLSQPVFRRRVQGRYNI